MSSTIILNYYDPNIILMIKIFLQICILFNYVLAIDHGKGHLVINNLSRYWFPHILLPTGSYVEKLSVANRYQGVPS